MMQIFVFVFKTNMPIYNLNTEDSIFSQLHQ